MKDGDLVNMGAAFCHICEYPNNKENSCYLLRACGTTSSQNVTEYWKG